MIPKDLQKYIIIQPSHNLFKHLKTNEKLKRNVFVKHYAHPLFVFNVNVTITFEWMTSKKIGSSNGHAKPLCQVWELEVHVLSSYQSDNQRISHFATMYSTLLTLSLIQQFCSRRLWTYFVKTWKISIIEWITYDKKWITLWQKEKLHILCNFFFCHYVFKKPSAAKASESIYMREKVKLDAR